MSGFVCLVLLDAFLTLVAVVSVNCRLKTLNAAFAAFFVGFFFQCLTLAHRKASAASLPQHLG